MAWLGNKQVLTWEPASNLPQLLVDEYEKGICPDEATLSESKYGVVNHTLILERHKEGPPEFKKQKLCRNWDGG